MNLKNLFGRAIALLTSFVMLISMTSPMAFAAKNVEQSQEDVVEYDKFFISATSPIVGVVEKAEQSQEYDAEYGDMLLGEDSPIFSIAENIEQSQEADKLHYVSLGASNTNGYGHHGYLDDEIYEDPLAANKSQMNDYGYDKAPANAYPALVKDALAESTGREVNYISLLFPLCELRRCFGF